MLRFAAFVLPFVPVLAAAQDKPETVRPIPPPGIAVPEKVRQELQAGVEDLRRDLAEVAAFARAKPALRELLPDIEIYLKAVDWALRYNEFYDAREFAVATSLLKQGRERLEQLRGGQHPWTAATGLVVRGYRSKIDGSVQPYGLVVPDSYAPSSQSGYRLDLWWHGRGEKLSELSFIQQRQTSVGDFAPRGAFVLHPYGRYCNANKFAGEVDTFEAMEHVKKHYRIDENRIVARGFSMGGAACWQFATHFPDVWCAAAPGAGFAETAEFSNIARDKAPPTAWEKTLWHWYDSTDYALNLSNVPTIAYSGEIDKQKQAADVMARALAKDSIVLSHIIGPKTGHAYHPQAKEEIERRLAAILEIGRETRYRLRFSTWTLRYNRCDWVRLDGLDRHWQRAHADIDLFAPDSAGIVLTTSNVAALTLDVPPNLAGLFANDAPKLRVDGQALTVPRRQSDRWWMVHLRKSDGKWSVVESPDDGSLRKRPGLQGPIDDAFCDRFLMVRPTGKPMNEKVGSWAQGEMAHAIGEWRRTFRGDAPVKDDSAVNDADIANANLVLWGDPSSNTLLAKIADRLPVRWTAEGVRIGDKTFPADTHVPVFIFPNPLNPRKYVVLNSGFTFREADHLSNARQVPKLPDWAVLDVSVPPSPRAAGKVVAADFFDEEWRIK